MADSTIYGAPPSDLPMMDLGAALAKIETLEHWRDEQNEWRNAMDEEIRDLRDRLDRVAEDRDNLRQDVLALQAELDALIAFDLEEPEEEESETKQAETSESTEQATVVEPLPEPAESKTKTKRHPGVLF